MKNKISKMVSGALIFCSGIITNWISSNPKCLYIPTAAFCIWGTWMIFAAVHTYVSKQEADKRLLALPPPNALLTQDGNPILNETPLKNIDPPPATTAITPTPASRMTPREIQLEIINARPYQRDDIAASFKNAPVNWDLTLQAISRDMPIAEKNTLQIGLSDGPDPTHGYVIVRVPIEGNEKLSMLEAGASIKVTGRIEKADALWINVKDASLEIIDKNDSKPK